MPPSPRPTLGDYLATEDPYRDLWLDLVAEVYADDPRRADLTRVSPPARTLYLAGVLRGEVGMGGLSTFFSNSSGNHVAETLEALDALGAVAVKALLHRAFEPFGGATPPADRERRCELLFSFEAEHPERLEALDAEFHTLERDLLDREARFLAAHADAPVRAAGR